MLFNPKRDLFDLFVTLVCLAQQLGEDLWDVLVYLGDSSIKQPDSSSLSVGAEPRHAIVVVLAMKAGRDSISPPVMG